MVMAEVSGILQRHRQSQDVIHNSRGIKGACGWHGTRQPDDVSIKQQVLTAIQRLPDDIDFRDVTDEIAFLAAIQEAEDDIRKGRTVANETMRSRIEQWLAP